MAVLNAKIGGTWVPISFTSPPEVHIGSAAPTGPQTIWIDTSTSPPTTRAWVGAAWVVVGAVAPEEVFIGAADPAADPAVELWYDTDAIAAPALSHGMPIYATLAAMQASSWPAGTRASLTNGVLYRNVSPGVWGRETPLAGATPGPAGTWAGATNLITVNFAAEPIERILSCAWHCLLGGSTGGDMQFLIDGAYFMGWRPNAGTSMMDMIHYAVTLSANVSHSLVAKYAGGGSVQTFSDANFHNLTWQVHPRLA